ncbi:ANM_HP_G0137280.mRNA.1.CDS.1 [Saccharomyces cerevisiae]|nr:ANM_HP_G0137280.mRNA.1.CDS.1 [Saccharomyces cerevisiae]CAI5160418.1 BEM_HP_G0082730.mRNA.1.CDS.1 [Saccharomyces cerevisiae]CAI6718285.1 ANM_HP_G0137280.mRNA.1.CDS.1 [Saccharomyces cerevisiae]CAI6994226.1 BEM_HP_G0082730.mRNA.1.CDS.1 [Saccharomyces cerevisiae]
MICYFLVVTINFLKEKTTICHYFVNIFSLFLFLRKCSLFCLTLIKITYTSPNHGFMVTGKEKFEKLRD